MKKSVVDINGRRYDSETGAFLGVTKAASAKPNQDLQEKRSSTTLNRQFVQKPKLQLPAKINDLRATSKPRIIHNKRRSMDIISLAKTSSPKISKFNPGDFNPTNRPVVISEVKNPDITVTPEQQEIFKRALDKARQTDVIQRYRASQIERARRQQYRKLFTKNAPASKKSSIPAVSDEQARTIQKNSTVNQALAQVTSKDTRSTNFWSFIKPTKWILIISGLIIIVLGWLAYLNWPILSLTWTNHQAGLKANVPSYQPTNYRFSSSASSRKGQITLYLTNQDHQIIAIVQEESSWDSDAVLDNFVKPEVGDNYTIYRDQGLTIYAYQNNQDDRLAWVNGGLLYHITADAQVPDEQLRQLATSL